VTPFKCKIAHCLRLLRLRDTIAQCVKSIKGGKIAVLGGFMNKAIIGMNFGPVTSATGFILQNVPLKPITNKAMVVKDANTRKCNFKSAMKN
jgi:hypothetical protein